MQSDRDELVEDEGENVLEEFEHEDFEEIVVEDEGEEYEGEVNEK